MTTSSTPDAAASPTPADGRAAPPDVAAVAGVTADIAPPGVTAVAGVTADIAPPGVTAVAGVTAVVWPADVPLDDDGDAIVGAAWGTGATLVVVPAAALPASFFDLSTGVAGALLQRLVNYRFRVAVVGDLAAHLAESRALRDFVAESNRGRQVWFLPDDAALAARLTQP